MPFRFSLESVLKHRTRLEEIAQREFAEAQAAVDECLRRLEAMYKRSDEVREEILSTQARGAAGAVQEIREMEHFISGQKIRIEAVRQEARALLIIAEAKQEALIAAARDKTMLVKLKEKRRLQYNDWLKQQETKELDDLTMMRQARGKR